MVVSVLHLLLVCWPVFHPSYPFLAEQVSFPYRRAKDLVQSNIEILHKTAAVLMEKEQIDGEEFQRIVDEAQAEQYLKPDAEVEIPYRTAAIA